MATYDVTSHGSLSTAASDLYSNDADAFDAYAIQAERLLDLKGTTFTGDDAKEAKLAVAIQVSHLIALDSDVMLRSMEVRGSVTNAYRAGTPSEVHPVAAGIARGLGRMTESSFRSVRRLR